MSEQRKSERKKAVALGYDSLRQDAPRVIATGKGKVAENIIRAAKENQVPIQEDPALVHLLGQLDIHQSIPDELYKAVAEVFAFIYQTEKEAGKQGKSLLPKGHSKS